VSRGTVILLAIALLCIGAGVASYSMLRPAQAPEAAADAEDDGDDDDDGPGAEMQAKAKICKKLSCTESQRGELGTLIRSFRDETRDRRTEVKNLRASAAELWASAEPDTARVTELETRVWTLEGEVEARAREALLTFHRVLDEEQRRKLSKWLRRKSARDLLQDRRNREPEAAQ
jgi:Spy/CpxP family protein refolding chaperone